MSGNLISRAVDAYQSGGMRRLGIRSADFFRRRLFRARAAFQNLEAEIELVDEPREVVAGCMYRIGIRITNKSSIAWNRTDSHEPRFAVGTLTLCEGGTVLEGPHTVLPADFQAGQTATVDVVVEVPRNPGNCSVRFDVVREGCFWLSELGSRSPRIPLRVSPHSSSLLSQRIPALDVTLDITNKCPLKCIQCRKTYFETLDEQQDMNFPLFERISRQIFPYARAVSLSSAGEPLMTRNFLDAIALTQKLGVSDISFISSGMHMDHLRAEKIIDYGVTRIEFSLDGATAEVYNKIRIGSNFNKVIKNIAYLSELKKKKLSQTPLLRFNFVLMKSNIHELPLFIDLAASLGVEEVQTQHMVIFVPDVESEALVFDKERSNQFLLQAKERARYHGIRFFHPPLFDLDTGTSQEGTPEAKSIVDGTIWMEEGGYSYERKTHPVITDGMQLCTDPWRKLFIDWQGQVFPCCVWKEAPLGDLRQNTFQEIWLSQRYTELREGLTTGALGKSCAECSVITGGDINSERSYFFY